MNFILLLDAANNNRDEGTEEKSKRCQLEELHNAQSETNLTGVGLRRQSPWPPAVASTWVTVGVW